MNRRAKARDSGPARRSLVMGISTFVIAFAVTLLSTSVSDILPLPVAALLILVIVAVGILFDMIGIAATAAKEAPLHAMAAKRTVGATQAIMIVRNADRVSNVCSDLVGDICGTVSGAAAAAIVFRMVTAGVPANEDLLSVVLISAVAAFTVGGKAAGKGYALDRANDIVFRVGALQAKWQGTIAATRRLIRGGGRALNPAAQGRRSEGQEVDRGGRRPRRGS